MGNPVQPVPHQFPRHDGGRLADQDEEGGLEGVLGVVVVEQAATHTPHHGAVPHEEGGEGRLVLTFEAAADPAAAAAFYRRLFGFGTLLESERLVALDVAGKNVLLLFKRGATGEPFATPGGVIPAHAGAAPTHFAFSIAAEDVEAWKARL